MKKLILSLILLSSINVASANEENMAAEFELWQQQAAQYRGNNLDLTIPSKRAIVLGQPELAEQPYLAAYNSEFGRKELGAESLYQIFLVYIDASNKARNTSKAKFYLDKMIAEWPEEIQTRKAQAVYLELEIIKGF